MNATQKLQRIFGACLFFPANALDFRCALPYRPLYNGLARLVAFSLRLMGAQIGENSFIRSHLYLSDPRLLSIGNNCRIGMRAEFFLYERLSIGDNVEIGSGLIVHTAEHRFDDPDRLLAKQGSVYRPVRIGNDCYFGSRVTIMAGVEIADRVVVGAGAVVTKNLESGFVYGGVPAKAIRALATNEVVAKAEHA